MARRQTWFVESDVSDGQTSLELKAHYIRIRMVQEVANAPSKPSNFLSHLSQRKFYLCTPSAPF